MKAARSFAHQSKFMAYQDLRSYLDLLEKEGQLLEITESILPEPDISAAACAVNKLGDTAPALLFSNIAGYTDARIAMNVHGSWRNHALMLGMPKDTPLKAQFHEFVRRYETYPGKVEERSSAPWEEVVIEDNINLFDILPLFRLNHGDGGFYIDKAVTISRDMDDWDNPKTQNVGLYRLQVKGKTRIGIQPVPAHDIAIHLRKAEELGVDLPIAICIGNDPLISSVGSMPILYDQSEYEMAGALAQEPYLVVTTKATGLQVGEAATALHKGATSQDLADTILMLQVAEAEKLLRADLSRVCAGLSAPAEKYAATPAIGRTLMQDALPIGFGLRLAQAMAGIESAAQRLQAETTQNAKIQFGGAAGTRAGLAGKGAAVARRMPEALGLAADMPWHARRGGCCRDCSFARHRHRGAGQARPRCLPAGAKRDRRSAGTRDRRARRVFGHGA